ncbi:LOW QUALITY PROTEIN: phosphoserine aminotransferase [Bacillus sp. JCM 19045]|nr:LOW QUALITY PROTEIN: phosphoserine aminotransferase [Bacillus sp. JCM 19045]
MSTIYNFNAGPAALPKEVLQKAQREMVEYGNTGMSVMELSHRSNAYEDIHNQAISRLKSIANVNQDYHVLFMQGGASLQFTSVAQNFLKGQSNYILTGGWSEKAATEAQKIGNVVIGASSKENQYRSIPLSDTLLYDSNDSYMHVTSNNTLYGTQWQSFPDVSIPLVCDMSSDILSRSIDMNQFDLVYAGAQKNLAPAGVTAIFVKDSFLKQANKNIPTMLSYQTYADSNSLYNTPPVYSIYMLNLVLEWIEERGGIDYIEDQNDQKAKVVYEAIDSSDGFYKGHAQIDARSKMNVTFTLATEALTTTFLKAAADAGFVGLPGHRSVGGCRASIYNSVSLESCEALAKFMNQFKKMV